MTAVQIEQERIRPTTKPDHRGVARTSLLLCGVLAPALYVAMLVVVPMGWEGYSSASQTVSELSAIGAPTRPLWVALGIGYALLTTAFGLGVLASSGRSRALRAAGGVLIAQSLVSLLWPPMHLRGTELTLTDAMHIAFAMAWLLLMLLAIGFGAAAFGRRFRLYSGATVAVFVVFGALTVPDGARIAANLPTPWVGVWERINIGASLLWLVVFAATLLRRPWYQRNTGRGTGSPNASPGSPRSGALWRRSNPVAGSDRSEDFDPA
jgi:Protein of unknown function (DUF998)